MQIQSLHSYAAPKNIASLRYAGGRNSSPKPKSRTPRRRHDARAGGASGGVDKHGIEDSADGDLSKPLALGPS